MTDDLPPRRAAGVPRRRAAAVLAEDPAREPAAHRGRRRRSRRPTSRRSPTGTTAAEPDTEIAFTPARVLLQDFTGVPAVVDLAAMRDAMADARRRPDEDQPAACRSTSSSTTRCRSTTSAPRDAFRINVELEFERNHERYAVPALGPEGVRQLPVVPPDTGIVHQVNLEYLARVVFVNDDDRRRRYPDTLVGTDSHTTMINGLGVLGWGVGGIEAEAAMLGQPISMLIPQVVGFKLHGRAARGRDGDRPRAHRHRDAAQEGRRRQVRRVLRRRASARCRSPTARRSRNMAPSTARRAAIFPVDAETLRYLRSPAAPTEQIALVEAYAKEQGLFRTTTTPGADVHRHARARPRRRSSRASPGPSARRTASR